MKTSRKIALFLSLALLVTGCDNHIDIEWSPIELIMLVSDPAGNDLVRPGLENVSIFYRDSLYQLSPGIEENIITESSYLITDGLHLYACSLKDELGNNYKYCLCFGEFSNTGEIDDNLMLTWTDGSVDILHLTTKQRGGLWPKRMEYWKLNGKDCNNPVRIIKNS